MEICLSEMNTENSFIKFKKIIKVIPETDKKSLCITVSEYRKEEKIDIRYFLRNSKDEVGFQKGIRISIKAASELFPSIDFSFYTKK